MVIPAVVMLLLGGSAVWLKHATPQITRRPDEPDDGREPDPRVRAQSESLEGTESAHSARDAAFRLHYSRLKGLAAHLGAVLEADPLTESPRVVGERHGIAFDVVLRRKVVVVGAHDLPPAARLPSGGPPDDPPTRHHLAQSRSGAAKLSWLHKDIRQSLDALMHHARFVRVTQGTLTVGALRGGSAVDALVESTIGLAVAVRAQPEAVADRLIGAFRDEDHPWWRLAFAQAVLMGNHVAGDDSLLTELLADPFHPIRLQTAAHTTHIPTLQAIVSDPLSSHDEVLEALHAVREHPGLGEVALSAVTVGLPLDTPTRRWVLDALCAAPRPELEPVLLSALDSSERDLQRAAVSALEAVGGTASVPPLRALSERWALPLLSRGAERALDAIRDRVGVQLGAVSLTSIAETEGALSEADLDGGLAVAGEE